MTLDLVFKCLVASGDPTVFTAMDRTLHDFSIETYVCLDLSEASGLLTDGSTDLVVVDLESEHSVTLIQKIGELNTRQKPTIVALSSSDEGIPGVHFVLRKPITPESAMKLVKAAYSRMLLDYRRYTRFAVMAPILATDENNDAALLTLTNIGEGGVGLTTNVEDAEADDALAPKRILTVGSILSFQVLLQGLNNQIHIQARVVWVREYGAAGCEFVFISPHDRKVLHAWLEKKYPFKTPFMLQ